MRLTVPGAAGRLALLIIVLGLSACGGGGSSGGSSGGSGGGGGAGGPPPPPGVTAPSALSYTAQSSYAVGAAITPLDPTVTSYGVTPALPAGLSLDATTGRIAGTPTAPSRSSHFVNTYTVGGAPSTIAIWEGTLNPTTGLYQRTFVRDVAYANGFVVAADENDVFVVTVPGSCIRLVRASANPTALS